ARRHQRHPPSGAPDAVRLRYPRRAELLLLHPRRLSHRAVLHLALLALALRGELERGARSASPHAHARAQRLAHPLGHLRHGRFLGFGGRRPLRLLQPVPEPARDIAAAIRRNPADGDPRRRQHAHRADRRRRHHHPRQERGVDLRRALEHAARHDLRRGDHVHAVRSRARLHAGVAAIATLDQNSQSAKRRRLGAGAMTTPALEVVHLSKRFGGLPATKNVSLSVMPGERRLIIGPNGAGKTTLFNLITGDLTADAGSVRLFGQELTGMPTQQRVHLGLARTYQILTLFPRERLIHNVVLSLLGLDRRRWNPWAILTANRHLYATPPASLARVGLGEAAERIVVETSYGERRRLELAMALAQKPTLLLLDEPLAGLSQAERQTVRALLDVIPRDVTIVMI